MSTNIMQLRNEVQQLKEELKETQSIVQKSTRIFTSYITLVRRLNLPPDVDAAVSKVQALISLVIRLRAAILALELASGPVGWGLAIGGFLLAGSMSLQDEFGSYG